MSIYQVSINDRADVIAEGLQRAYSHIAQAIFPEGQFPLSLTTREVYAGLDKARASGTFYERVRFEASMSDFFRLIVTKHNERAAPGNSSIEHIYNVLTSPDPAYLVQAALFNCENQVNGNSGSTEGFAEIEDCLREDVQEAVKAGKNDGETSGQFLARMYAYQSALSGLEIIPKDYRSFDADDLLNEIPDLAIAKFREVLEVAFDYATPEPGILPSM